MRRIEPSPWKFPFFTDINVPITIQQRVPISSRQCWDFPLASKLERILSNVDAHNVFVLLSGARDRLTLVYARCSRSQRIFNACTLPYKAISGAHVAGSEFIETEQTFVERAQRRNATKHKFLLVVKKTETRGILVLFSYEYSIWNLYGDLFSIRGGVTRDSVQPTRADDQVKIRACTCRVRTFTDP